MSAWREFARDLSNLPLAGASPELAEAARLVEVGDDAAVAKLASSLATGDELQRYIAIWALGRLEDVEQGLPALCRALADENYNVRIYAAKKLSSAFFDQEQVNEAFVLLSHSSDPDRRALAAFYLSELASPIGEDRLRELMEDREELNGPMLTRMGSTVRATVRDAAIVGLCERFRDDPLFAAEPEVKEKATRFLGGEKGLLDQLLPLLGDESVLIRDSVFRALRILQADNPDFGLDLAVQAFLTDDAPALRAAAISYLHCQAPDDLLSRALPLLSDAAPMVRARVLAVISGHGDSSQIDLILPYLNDESKLVRAETASALVKLAGPDDYERVHEALKPALSDPELYVSRRAGESLVELNLAIEGL